MIQEAESQKGKVICFQTINQTAAERGLELRGPHPQF